MLSSCRFGLKTKANEPGSMPFRKLMLLALRPSPKEISLKGAVRTRTARRPALWRRVSDWLQEIRLDWVPLGSCQVKSGHCIRRYSHPPPTRTPRDPLTWYVATSQLIGSAAEVRSASLRAHIRTPSRHTQSY